MITSLVPTYAQIAWALCFVLLVNSSSLPEGLSGTGGDIVSAHHGSDFGVILTVGWRKPSVKRAGSFLSRVSTGWGAVGALLRLAPLLGSSFTE